MAIKIFKDDLIFFVLKLFKLPTSMDYMYQEYWHD